MCNGIAVRTACNTPTLTGLAMHATGDGAVVATLPPHWRGSALIITLVCMRVDISMGADSGAMLRSVKHVQLPSYTVQRATMRRYAIATTA